MGNKKTKKTTRAELAEAVFRYGNLNPQKIEIVKEVKDLGDDIKDSMEVLGITKFDAKNGFTAVITPRTSRRLNVEKVEALLGRKIPDDCYDAVESVVLSVAAEKSRIA